MRDSILSLSAASNLEPTVLIGKHDLSSVCYRLGASVNQPNHPHEAEMAPSGSE